MFDRQPYVALVADDIKSYTHMLIQAVEACHARGLLHRDLKPGNLLIDSTGTLKLGTPAYKHIRTRAHTHK